MEKVTQINQFNGGMIKDIHPMMTPNTILTDCVNGTLITYNGNEFMLQNDMGNYAFTNGTLNRNFVPVGLKEYGGLLYIISYNPINNKVEIGTFPSQQTIWNSKSGESSSALDFISINEKYNLYTNIAIDNILLLSKDKDINFYLTAGDKYILLCKGDDGETYEDLLNGTNKKLNWQHLNLYALTDENKLYNINGYINFQVGKDLEMLDDYQPISWEIPGWLAARFELNTPTEFSAYFESKDSKVIEKIEDGKVYYTIVPSGILKLKTIWDSKIYSNSQLNYIKSHIKFLFHNENLESIIEVNGELQDQNGNKVELWTPNNQLQELKYNDIQIILYTQYTGETSNYNYVTPVLEISENNSLQYIIYNQFTTSIKLENYNIDKDKIQLGEDYFKYYTDQDSVTLYFDYESYPGVTLGYRILRYTDPRYFNTSIDNYQSNYLPVQLDSAGETVKINNNEYYIWSDINYNGINIVDIAFSKIHNTEINTFDKEDVYIIEFISYLSNSKISTEGTQIDNQTIVLSNLIKPLYISEVTNYYYSQDVFDFSDSDWAGVVALSLSIKANDLEKKLSSNVQYKVSTIPILNNEGQKEIFENNFEETIYNENNEWDSEVIKKHYGDPFVNYKMLNAVTNAAFYRNINRFVLQPENPENENYLFSLIVPTNQYNDIGRLWYKTNLTKISNNCVITDTLNKSHKVSIDINNNFNSTSNYKDINSEICFDIYDEYKLSVTSTPISKTISANNKTFDSLYSSGTFIENKFQDSGKYLKVDTVMRIVTLNNHELIGERSKLTNPVFGTFVDNKLYAGDSAYRSSEGTILAESAIQSIANGTASEEIKNYYLITDPTEFNSIKKWTDEGGIQSNSRFLERQGSDDLSPGTAWLNGSSTTKISNACYTIVPIIYESRDQKSVNLSGICETETYGFGIFSNSDNINHPYGLFYNNQCLNDINAQASVLSLWFALMYYARIAETTSVETFYFPNVTLTKTNFETFTSKYLNVEGIFKWNYIGNYQNTSIVNRDETLISDIGEKTITLILKNINSNIDDKFEEANGNNIINSRIAITQTFYLNDTNNTQLLLEQFISVVNNNSNSEYLKYSQRPNIQPKEVYLIDEYNSEKNAIKLNNLISILRYDGVRLYVPEDNEYYTGQVGLKFKKNGRTYYVYVANVCTTYADY